jgi:hypothetical protein
MSVGYQLVDGGVRVRSPPPSGVPPPVADLRPRPSALARAVDVSVIGSNPHAAQVACMQVRLPAPREFCLIGVGPVVILRPRPKAFRWGAGRAVSFLLPKGRTWVRIPVRPGNQSSRVDEWPKSPGESPLWSPNSSPPTPNHSVTSRMCSVILARVRAIV